MGHIDHKVTIVTCGLAEYVAPLEAELARIGLAHTPTTESPTNGYHTLVVLPSGSKSGWDAQEAHDQKIKELTAWLTVQTYGDGSSPYEWFVASCGSDEHRAEIRESSWHLYRGGVQFTRTPHEGKL